MKNNIVFGACNRQDFPQHFWDSISSNFDPKLFLWLGDAVYAPTVRLTGLRDAFDLLLKNHSYQQFSKTREIDGIWDDHDFGVNDGGRFVGEALSRKQLFAQFLSTNQHHQTIFPNISDGLYHSRTEIVDGVSIKFIFLDTRSNRDNHIIPSLGVIKFPFTALFAAGLRTFYSFLGIGSTYSGDILGESQWNWLNNTLTESTSDFHLLISSIQIMTSNPTVESWGHFPLARERLFRLLLSHSPPGLAFLSGDVHYGEISSLPLSSLTSSSTLLPPSPHRWFEFTSSGLTHSCSSSGLERFICPAMLQTFHRHRGGGGGVTFNETRKEEEAESEGGGHTEEEEEEEEERKRIFKISKDSGGLALLSNSFTDRGGRRIGGESGGIESRLDFSYFGKNFGLIQVLRDGDNDRKNDLNNDRNSNDEVRDNGRDIDIDGLHHAFLNISLISLQSNHSVFSLLLPSSPSSSSLSSYPPLSSSVRCVDLTSSLFPTFWPCLSGYLTPVLPLQDSIHQSRLICSSTSSSDSSSFSLHRSSPSSSDSSIHQQDESCSKEMFSIVFLLIILGGFCLLVLRNVFRTLFRNSRKQNKRKTN